MDEAIRPFSFPAFDTGRLHLRPLAESDIPFLLTVFGREETNLHTEYETIHTLEEAREMYEKYCVAKPGSFRHAIEVRATGERVGTIGLYGYTPEHRTATVGYEILREYWKKGYATEAFRGLIGYAYANTSVNRIDGSADPDNPASIRVLEKCGLRLEGVARQKFFYRGRFRDDVVYSILREEWAGKKANGPGRG